MTKVDAINTLIKDKDVDTNLISDGYHTFGELYEHRIVLFIALCNLIAASGPEYCNLFDTDVWKSKAHSDGSVWDGWFILGIGTLKDHQITYHLPISKWDECAFTILDRAPEWDGHTSADVLTRLNKV